MISDDYYNQNGITKASDVTKHDFEMLITKKTSIVYKCIKLLLKRKNEGS